MTLRGPRTPGAPSSTPTVRPGKPQPHPRDPSGPGPSSGSSGAVRGSAFCGGACGPGSSEPQSTCSFLSTCSRGKWTCQESARCSSTCTLYGEGHVVTFDGQRFLFEGNCEYILATVRPWGGGQESHRGGAQGGPGGAAGSSRLAPPQHSLPTGWLWHQRLLAHLQDPDRERGVRKVGCHLLSGHQSLPGGEQVGRVSPPGSLCDTGHSQWAAASLQAEWSWGVESGEFSQKFDSALRAVSMMF